MSQPASSPHNPVRDLSYCFMLLLVIAVIMVAVYIINQKMGFFDNWSRQLYYWLIN